MIHISRSVAGAAELEAMGRVIRDDGYLGMGWEVRAFRRARKEYLGGRDPRLSTQFRHRGPPFGGAGAHQPRG